MSGPTSYLRVVALLDGDSSDLKCLDAALTVAGRSGAQVLAVLPEISPVARLAWMSGAGAGVTAELAGALEAAVRQHGAEAEMAVDRARVAAGIPRADETLQFEHIQDFSIANAIAAAYSAADIVVCARPNAPQPGWNEAFQSALIVGRVPCILVRREPILSGKLALAWDGGGPARRALHAAMPLIRAAGEVAVLWAPEGLSDRQRQIAAPEALCALLRRQGIAATVSTVAGGAKEGATLIAAANAMKASLLICGAFGHARAQEFLFGGATRSFLEAADGPSLLMAH